MFKDPAVLTSLLLAIWGISVSEFVTLRYDTHCKVRVTKIIPQQHHVARSRNVFFVNIYVKKQFLFLKKYY